MNNMSLKYINIKLITVALTLGTCCIMACTKFADPAPVYEDYGGDSSAAKIRKVLVIGIDGLAGSDLKALKPVNLNTMMEHSKYTMGLLKEQVNDDVSAWKSLATGVGYAKHLTSDSSFAPQGDETDPEEATENPNNVFHYLLRYKPLDHSLLITPWGNLANLLLKGATKSIIVANDKAVRDSAVIQLKSGNSDLSILNFNSVALAGKQSGFGQGSADFKTAVARVDGYIKDIVEAIHGRDSYNQENWLILVTSNRGPNGDNPNQGFMMAYNDNFSEQEVKRNGAYAPYLNYNGSTNMRYEVPDDQGLYNFGTDKPFTVQFTINVSSATLSFPFFFGKKLYVNSGASATGWVFYFGYDKGWSMDFGNKRSAGYRLGGTPYTNTLNMRDGNWYTITAVVSVENGKRYVRGYTYLHAIDSLDVGGKSELKTAIGDISTDAPLTIGHLVGSPPSDEGKSSAAFQMRNVKIFNVALDSATIASTVCLQDMTKHPDYQHLIGYWPCDDGAGGVIRNYAPIANPADFISEGGNQWDLLDPSKLPCNVEYSNDATNPNSIIAKNADIAANALTWLRVDIKEDWELDGIPWITDFEIEYVK
jgi:hypothetical protein